MVDHAYILKKIKVLTIKCQLKNKCVTKIDNKIHHKRLELSQVDLMTS